MSGETVSDTTELGNGNMQGLLIVGNSVDVQQHSRVVEALEQYNKFQKEKHLTTVTDNDNAAVKEDDHVETIAVVPTIIIFKDGEEVKRFQADLSFKLLATRKEVQEEIDEQLMSDF